jgi:hypothetical protein
MGIGTNIVLVLIALHLILGFGWLVYKLSPRKKEEDKKDGVTK